MKYRYIILILSLLLFLFCTREKKIVPKKLNIKNKFSAKSIDFSFAVYGEGSNSKTNHIKIIKLISKLDVDLIINTGNIIPANPVEKNWDNLFRMFSPISGKLARFYITPGKNERKNIDEIKNRFANISELMKDRTYYSFTYKNALFLIINSYMRKALYKQHEFMLRALKNFIKTINGPVFVFSHTPVYSTGPSGVSKFLTRQWLILLEHFRTNIIFSAKDRLYARCKTSDATSTICLISGGASDWNDKCGKSGKEFEQYICIPKPHFIYVGVKRNRIGVRVIDINNRVIDSFETIVKSRRHTRKGIPRLYRPF